MTRICTVVLIASGICACVPPPVAPGIEVAEETQLAAGLWLLRVVAEQDTDPSRALAYWHQHAAELALRESCADYDAIDLVFDAGRSVAGTGPIVSTHTRASVVGRVRCRA